MPGPTRFTDAILLRSVDYGDADRIVTLLTREHGKLGALARGARRSRKRFGGALEPFCVLEVELGAGRGSLERLAQATLRRPFPGVLASLDRVTAAGAAMELLRGAIPERAPAEDLFDAALTFLEALSEGGPVEELTLGFQLRVLALLGLQPGLGACVVCGREAPAGHAALFDPARGALVCRACGGASLYLSGESRERMQAALEGDFSAPIPWSEPRRAEVATALSRFVEHHLGRPLAGGGRMAHRKREPDPPKDP